MCQQSVAGTFVLVLLAQQSGHDVWTSRGPSKLQNWVGNSSAPGIGSIIPVLKDALICYDAGRTQSSRKGVSMSPHAYLSASEVYPSNRIAFMILNDASLCLAVSFAQNQRRQRVAAEHALPARSMTIASEGMVACCHPLAAEIGLDVSAGWQRS